MNTRVIGISAAFIIAGLQAAAFTAETNKTERQISVQGRGKLSAPPDQARLTVAVQEEGSRVEAVTQEVRRKMDAVLKVLKGQGIADKDIQTQAYQVAPKMEWKNGRSNRVGYIATNQVEVKIHDLKKTGTVLAAVLESGANNVTGPQFEFENPQELERKALALAVQDAKAKASLLAQTAGATLGEVVSIQEGGIARPVPRPMMMRGRALELAAAAPEEPIATGEETLEVNVTVVFALK